MPFVSITGRPSETQFNVRIGQPDVSRHTKFKPLGIPLPREQALESPLKDDFFEVADYVVANDPALNSYLSGMHVNIFGWTCKHKTAIN